VVGDIWYTGGKRSAYRILVGKSEEKRPFGKPTHKKEDNIKACFEEIGFGGMKTGRQVEPFQYGNETLGSIKCMELEWIKTISFS